MPKSSQEPTREFISKNNAILIVFILVGIGAGLWLALNAEKQVTPRNWKTHPEIAAINKLQQAIRAEIKGGSLKALQRNFDPCQPYQDKYRRIYLDAQGRAGAYVAEGGDKNTGAIHEHFYDDQGRLRYIQAKATAVNGTVFEYRLYFAISGKKLWENSLQGEGPGYTFNKHWPKQGYVRDPKSTFKASHPCRELEQGQPPGQAGQG